MDNDRPLTKRYGGVRFVVIYQQCMQFKNLKYASLSLWKYFGGAYLLMLYLVTAFFTVFAWLKCIYRRSFESTIIMRVS